jgi:putrescine transport system permease protein
MGLNALSASASTVSTNKSVAKPFAWLSKSWLGAGYLFLYAPIVVLIVYSFNDSKIASAWGGFTFKWYGEMLNDREIMDGFALSLKIAFLTACASVVLGTFAAYVLDRYRQFRGRTLFSGMVNAPLVMPEVIVGLSLLLLMVSIQKILGWPDRSWFTIWIGHTLLGMAYAAVVVQARLQEMDKSLEEAAMDLGCKPAGVFYRITLPLLTPSLVSAWLLTFTISLDDVVLSAFLSGPGSTTLPIVIFSRAKLGLNPTVNAVAAVTVLLVSMIIIGGSLWMSKREKKRLLEQSLAMKS